MQVDLVRGDAFAALAQVQDESFDLVFVDPPYFLSRKGGTTCRGGKRVSVDKGAWDRPPQTIDDMHAWNCRWLSECKRVLRPDGTIWVSGTHHVIHSIGFAMQQLEFKIINEITWEKPNPPPNLSCRSFTHSTETVLWAARSAKSRYHFDYHRMRELNQGKQKKSVWTIGPPRSWETKFGKHPTQKPEVLLAWIIQASLPPGGSILDPFMGSGTTVVAALELALGKLVRPKHFLGVEADRKSYDLAVKRVNDMAMSGAKFVMNKRTIRSRVRSKRKQAA